MDEPSPETSTDAPEQRRLRRIASAPIVGLFVLAIMYTLYLGRPIFVPLALAILLSLLLYPIVSLLHRRFRVPNAAGAGLVVGVLLAVFALAAIRLGAPASEWMERLPEAMHEAEWKIRKLKEPIDRVQEATEQIEDMAGGEKSPGEAPVVRVQETSYMQIVMNQTWWIVGGAALTIALLYFLLASGDLFMRKLVKELPTMDHKREAVAIIDEIRHDISTYILTITAINAGLGVATGTAMYLLGMPNSVLWGLMAMLLNYIPYAGAIVGTIVVGLIALITQDNSTKVFLVMGAYYALTLIEGTFMTPMILGKRLLLNPVAVFISLLLWGWMWGIVGALIAVPLMAAFKIVCDHVPPLRPMGVLLGR
jgi:predicted PurR-regulated permease PerM